MKPRAALVQRLYKYIFPAVFVERGGGPGPGRLGFFECLRPGRAGSCVAGGTRSGGEGKATLKNDTEYIIRHPKQSNSAEAHPERLMRSKKYNANITTSTA